MRKRLHSQERKAQNSTFPVFSTLSGDRLLLAGILLLIQSLFCRSDPIRSDSDFADGHSQSCDQQTKIVKIAKIATLVGDLCSLPSQCSSFFASFRKIRKNR